MKKITDIASPTTMLGLNICVLVQIFLFFKPTFSEVIVFFSVDLLMFCLAMKSDAAFFRYFFPQSAAFFPKLNEEKISQASNAEKIAIYKNMVRYPLQRSLYMIPANIIKVFPGGLVAVFYWQHPNNAIGLAIAYFFVNTLFNITYMSAMVYHDNHAYLSAQLRAINVKYNWSAVFKSANLLPPKKATFNKMEAVAILPLWLFAVVLQASLLFDDHQPMYLKLLESLSFAFFACYFTMRILLVGRQPIVRGIQEAFNSFTPGEIDKMPVMAFSTVPVVAYFQGTLNDLIARLREQEVEISSWLVERVEKRRYLEMGEITSLVVHDLVNPLHAIGYCVEALLRRQGGQANGQEQRYLEQISANTNECVNLLKNVLTNVRTPHTIGHSSCIFTADRTVRRMLMYRFKPEVFMQINFLIEAKLEGIEVGIPQPELNQILMNLYSNSIKNLLHNRVSNPTIKLAMAQETPTHCCFCVEDNGTGLSGEDFEFITDSTSEQQISNGIGLRLTKRLIQHHGGSLKLLPSQGPAAGSVFLVSLKKSTQRCASVPDAAFYT